MEHKLILGGEQYLPFARSRIKALKAGGLKYASQSFEVDGVSINVKIAGEHEYIRLEGGPTLLSGVVKDGALVDGKVRSFRPTTNAWEKVMKKKPEGGDSFTDNRLLAKAGAGAQYATMAASRYSGLLGKAVQIIMGSGKEVKYKSSWLITHGVVLDSDQKPWLVEISKDNGVIAMPFHKKGGGGSSKIDAVDEATKLFGGLPSGKTFPLEADLPDAIDEGKVIRLATKEALDPVFTKKAYAAYLGWSFNDDGSEAHNTCYRQQASAPEDVAFLGTTGTGDQIDSYHYKITISITAADGSSPAEGEATLSQASTGRVIMNSGTGEPLMLLSDPEGGYTGIPFQSFVPNYPAASTPLSTTLLVMHSAGELVEVKLVSPAWTPTNTTPGDPDFPWRRIICAGLKPVYPRVARGTFVRASTGDSYTDVSYPDDPPDAVVFPIFVASISSTSFVHSSACRDAVAHRTSMPSIGAFQWRSTADDVTQTFSPDAWYAIYQNPDDPEDVTAVDITSLVPTNSGVYEIPGGEFLTTLWPDGRATDDKSPTTLALDNAIQAWLSGYTTPSFPETPGSGVTTGFSAACSVFGPTRAEGLPHAIFSAGELAIGDMPVGSETATSLLSFVGYVK